MNLPRDRATINAWCRSFFALNPTVHNAIDLHSSNVMSDFCIDYKNIPVRCKNLFQDMIYNTELMTKISFALTEYWVLGETFIYAEFDESNGVWNEFKILNPDYINVKSRISETSNSISLRLDERLRRVVIEGNELELKNIDPAVIEHVKKGNDIPLDDFYVHQLARKISPYEIRGTSIIVSCFRSLICFDSKLRNDDFCPDISAAELVDDISRGLMVPDFIDEIALKILNRRYKSLKFQLSDWLIKKIFSPMSKLNDFYDYVDGSKNLILPKVSWNKENYNE
jgi:hypothetical protein